MPGKPARKQGPKAPVRAWPPVADYSDEVTDEHVKRIKDLVPEEEYEEAEEVGSPGW